MRINKIIQNIAAIILPRLDEILFVAIFAAVIGLGPRMMNVDGDLGRHITLGTYILDSRSIPTSDIFSFSKYGNPLTPHEWLADVLFALANIAGGLNGVVWLTGVILAATFWLVYKHSQNLSNMSLVALSGVILGAAASSIHWLTRPHIFTILFAALWTMELEKMELGLRKNWLIFPVLMLLWVNLHGAFIAGLMIWLCYFVGLALKRNVTWVEMQPLLGVGLSSFLVSLINPDGFGVWKTGLGFLRNQYLVGHTAEYLPPDFQNPGFWPFLLLIVGTLMVFAIAPKKLKLAHVFLVGGWTAMSLFSARNIPLYVVTVVPVLSAEFSELLKAGNNSAIINKILDFQSKITDTERHLKGGLWAVLIILISAALFTGGYKLDFENRGNEFSKENFPVEAVDWMEKNPPIGNGFNYFPWGGYLLYRTWPDRLVFIDGQTDFYGEDLTRKYERVITMSGDWQKVMEEYQIQWVIMPSESELINSLETNSQWTSVYKDQTAVILIISTEQ